MGCRMKKIEEEGGRSDVCSSHSSQSIHCTLQYCNALQFVDAQAVGNVGPPLVNLAPFSRCKVGRVYFNRMCRKAVTEQKYLNFLF